MIRWLTVFADLPADRFEPTVAFWAAVTGSTVSARRGDLDEFATLLPASGTPVLKVQRLGSGSARLHLDIHVLDVAAATAQAAALGAEVLHAGGWSVLSSPAGFVHCLVGHFAGDDPPPPFTLPGAGASLVNQLAIDIPADHFTVEVAYWTALTGWPTRPSASYPEFTFLEPPAGTPYRLLLQRLGDDDERSEATGHLDVAAGGDVAALAAAHVERGARIEHVGPHWTTLTDPAGLAYCLTIRDPAVEH